MKKFNNKGQSMYEVVVAIAVIAFSLLAVVGLAISSVAATTYTKNKSNANRYTQEAMEWIRSERNANWDTFYYNANSHGSGFCIGSLNWSGGGCAVAGNATFQRRVYFNVIAGRIDVRVETSWQDERGTHVSEASTTFTNW